MEFTKEDIDSVCNSNGLDFVKVRDITFVFIDDESESKNCYGKSLLESSDGVFALLCDYSKIPYNQVVKYELDDGCRVVYCSLKMKNDLDNRKTFRFLLAYAVAQCLKKRFHTVGNAKVASLTDYELRQKLSEIACLILNSLEEITFFHTVFIPECLERIGIEKHNCRYFMADFNHVLKSAKVVFQASCGSSKTP